ncbi:hypothetical protein LJ656_21100 [Paraburkholderia sp. MMS20-SJTR3]|uniref:Type VI secretion system protein ImpL n=1 Tax=Paraburkholderia sejongensis TaxID=2886946 RepID=A0ABS8JYV8_9BURK|nr:hypothetical protein [Paraburkholderia sp. MMS20-SJTR3]MCC8395092.1 hypothetical protein [Paraburkholderia sp. MMS20-SJTR3]
MSSTPLTLIEGAYALPRLRPLERLPEPFGRDWSFLPTGKRWREELESLYAALLRTVCIGEGGLLGYGQWVTFDHMRGGVQRLVAAKPAKSTRRGAARSAAPKPVARTASFDTTRKNPLGPTRIPLRIRTPGTARRRGSWQRRVVAAGVVCALGCVALFAWLRLAQHADQTPRQVVEDMLKPLQTLLARGDARSQKQDSQNDAVARQAAAPGGTAAQSPGGAAVRAEVVPSVRKPDMASGTASVTASASSSTETSTSVVASARNAATPTALSSDTRSSSTRPVARMDTHRPAAARYAANSASHGSGFAHGAYVSGRPGASAAAKRNAMRAPDWLGTDDYDSVTMSAALHLLDHAAPARSNAVPANSTEWANHLSQRRVTEIPDRFTR